MKNQYFGDKRDYFKWNLILSLTESQVNKKSLTYLPMLTPNDTTNEGLFTDYPVAGGNKYIHDYLCDCLSRGYRNIKALRTMFSQLDVNYEHYWDDQFFTNDKRHEYFVNVPTTALQDKLVFIDPDVGTEPRSQAAMTNNGIEKYLLWADLDAMHPRLGAGTTLLIYQHLQFNAHRVTGDLSHRCEHLELIWPEKIVDYLRDKDVAFLIVHNNKAVTSCLNEIASLHGLFTRADDTSNSHRDVCLEKQLKSNDNNSATETSVIDDVEGLIAQDVVNRQVLCPACREKVFARWPLGWDAHTIRCRGIEGVNPIDRKRLFKTRFRHLFR